MIRQIRRKHACENDDSQLRGALVVLVYVHSAWARDKLIAFSSPQRKADDRTNGDDRNNWREKSEGKKIRGGQALRAFERGNRKELGEKKLRLDFYKRKHKLRGEFRRTFAFNMKECW